MQCSHSEDNLLIGVIVVPRWKLYFPVEGEDPEEVQALLHRKCADAKGRVRDVLGFVDYPILAAACCTTPLVFDPEAVNPVGWRSVIESCHFESEGCVFGGADLLQDWGTSFQIPVPNDVASDDIGCFSTWFEVGDLMVRGFWSMLGSVLVHRRPRKTEFLWPLPHRRLLAYIADRLCHRVPLAVAGHSVQVLCESHVLCCGLPLLQLVEWLWVESFDLDTNRHFSKLKQSSQIGQPQNKRCHK